MQRKEEFSFLLFGFLTDPVHVNTEERKQARKKAWAMQTISPHTGHRCHESEEENGTQDAKQTLKLLTNDL